MTVCADGEIMQYQENIENNLFFKSYCNPFCEMVNDPIYKILIENLNITLGLLS